MPTSRLIERFARCKKQGRTAFVAFITAGCPDQATTVKAMHGFEENGVDVIELGVPFSDPVAEGPTIQESSEVALANGTCLSDCFNIARQARDGGLHTPVVLMGYYNSFLAYGIQKVCADAQRSGVDGFLIVDLPPEDARSFLDHCEAHDLSFIPLVTPTTTRERCEKLLRMASSWVYVVSRTGTTGATEEISQDAVAMVKMLRECNSEIPICIGFGMCKREHVVSLGSICDGVIVGSALVKKLQEQGLPKMLAFVRELSGGPGLNEEELEVPPAKYRKILDEHSEWNFGSFGGRYIPETLMSAFDELERAWRSAMQDPAFMEEVGRLRREYIGGPTPIYHAKNLSKKIGGAQIWFKREELAHTGAHKINNAIGQALLAKRIGKRRIIAETGAGQHGVATATACALLGLDCTVYMGAVDVERQALNVFKIRMLGAEVIPVETGSRTLKDAVNAALRDWVTHIRTTHYILGSAVGPHPFPDIVRDFQAVLSKEARAQMLNEGNFTTPGPGRLPDVLVACVGGGSNAIGFFQHFLEDSVRIVGVEAGGVAGPPCDGGSEKHAAPLTAGTHGVLHGTLTYVQQTSDGNICETHSISAGLDYPGVGPQHAFLKDSGRVTYTYATDAQALDAMQVLSRTEGIIPALEPSHALAVTMKMAAEMSPEEIILMNLCGRGDKDMENVGKILGHLGA